MSSPHPLHALFLAIACLLAPAGCGNSAVPCTITGEVLVNGKPTEGVYVVLFPTDAETTISEGSARTAADGTFSIKLPREGSYAVTAFFPSTELDEGAVVEGPDRFAGRYRAREKPITTINVIEGENHVEPFKLK